MYLNKRIIKAAVIDKMTWIQVSFKDLDGKIKYDRKACLCIFQDDRLLQGLLIAHDVTELQAMVIDSGHVNENNADEYVLPMHIHNTLFPPVMQE